jgi:hypothetical protein
MAFFEIIIYVAMVSPDSAEKPYRLKACFSCYPTDSRLQSLWWRANNLSDTWGWLEAKILTTFVIGVVFN